MNVKVAIIGGGFSGIYALKYCVQEKLKCKLFESSDSIGGVWKYDKNKSGGVLKNTYASSSITFLHPTDYPFPNNTPEFPHHSVIYNHLVDYVKYFDLNQYIQLHTYITNITKKNNKWIVNYLKDDTNITELFDKIIICTGVHQNINIPNDINFNEFDKKKIIHSHYYEQNREKFKGKNVMIIGGGETAHDIACDLSTISNKVYMSIRKGQWFQGKIVGPYESADLYFNRYMIYIWCKPFAKWIGFLNEFIWGKGGTGIEKWKPNSTYGDSFLTKGRECLLWIAKGKIIPCSGITKIDNSNIYCNDEIINADYIILCTGYNNSHLKKILPNIDYNKNKYKLIFDPDDTSLSYCGFIRPFITSLPLVSELQARLISNVYSNKVELPDKNSIMKTIKKDDDRRKSRFSKDYDRLNYLINPYTYCDEISNLIGCKPNMFKLFFTNHRLWRTMFFFPWSQFHYTINSDNEKTKKISIEQLEKTRNSLAGKRLKYLANIGTICVAIVLLIIIGILIGIIFGFVHGFKKIGPYIVQAFSILMLLIIPL